MKAGARRGFTVMELLTALVVIAVLAAVAVPLWRTHLLRVRSDATEAGFNDAHPLAYADASFVPTAVEATQRRQVIERTVALRNVRP